MDVALRHEGQRRQPLQADNGGEILRVVQNVECFLEAGDDEIVAPRGLIDRAVSANRLKPGMGVLLESQSW